MLRILSLLRALSPRAELSGRRFQTGRRVLHLFQTRLGSRGLPLRRLAGAAPRRAVRDFALLEALDLTLDFLCHS
jgi:hypothetical protein